MGKAEVLEGLHASAAHQEQKQAWAKDLQAFEKLKADHEDELRRVRGEAYQVTLWYAGFQGVIMAALSQASLLNCSLAWSPVLLSVTIGVGAVLAMVDHLYNMGEVREDIKETGLNMSAILEYLDKVEEHGCDLNLETAQPRQEYRRDKYAGYRYITSADGVSALVCLACFAIFIALFSHKSLCRHCRGC